MEKANNKLTKLKFLVQDLKNNFDFFELANLDVSKNNVGWHLDHSMKVVIEIAKSVESSDVAAYKKNFNLKKVLVFLTGSIPRGKGKAPQIVRPLDRIAISDLKNQLQMVEISLEKLNNFDDFKNFQHPYFGLLNLEETIKFIEIHTFHHLKIVRDIRK